MSSVARSASSLMRSMERTFAHSFDSTTASYPVPVPISSTFSLPLRSSNSIMRATMYGCEIVCFDPIGSAPGPYAFAATSCGTKRWRGTSRIAARTRSSLIPRAATCRSTISARRCASSRSSAFCDGGKKLLERLWPLKRFVMRQIEMQRRDRDVSVFHRFEVRPRSRMPRRLATTDPVGSPSPRIRPLDHALGVDPSSELRDFQSLESADRKVDVEDDLRIAVAFEHSLRQRGRELGAAIDREVLADERGERDRWDVEQRAFECS